MTLTAELNQKAKPMLIRELGPGNYNRFIQQYEEGTGNYTRGSHQWLGEENAQSLHEQSTQLANIGEHHRPACAKLFTPKDRALSIDFLGFPIRISIRKGGSPRMSQTISKNHPRQTKRKRYPGVMNIAEVIENALALPLADRSYVTAKLIESLENDELSNVAIKEYDARVERWKSDKTTSSSASELDSKIQEILVR